MTDKDTLTEDKGDADYLNRQCKKVQACTGLKGNWVQVAHKCEGMS